MRSFNFAVFWLSVFFILCSATRVEETVLVDHLAKVESWRIIKKSYSNEMIIFLVSGDLSLSEKQTESGDNWTGTGTAIGLDEKSNIKFMATYANSRKNGIFLVNGDSGGVAHAISLSKWLDGKSIEHTTFVLKSSGMIEANGIPMATETKK